MIRQPHPTRSRVGILLGTRPEAVKLAPVITAMAASAPLEPVIVSTGQHRDLLGPVLADFGLRPDDDLDLMRPGQQLSDLAGRALQAVGAAVEAHRLDAVVVQGDTTTALAGALAGFYRQVPVVHVEAGLRTGDLRSPYPEEANRRLIGRIADLHCAPTRTAAEALLAEGLDPQTVHDVGNTVVDALHATLARSTGYAGRDADLLASVHADARPLLLVTAHRRESWGAGLAGIAEGVARAVADHPALQVVLPLHPNPVVQQTIAAVLPASDRVHLVGALDYPDFVRLLRRADVVLTDSGGVQEEACTLGRPTLVARDTTERPEGEVAGGLLLVGTDPVRIRREIGRLLTDPDAQAALTCRTSPFGDGRAAERIVALVADLLGHVPAAPSRAHASA